jgi:crotonobetainyl-CoA:carnitine CoA-transferase CaiB-like acyl-CoA transferase
MGERVFDGLKVIDCASIIAGPAAATVMSDFGAEVIEIEPSGAGDPYRRRATPPIGPELASNPGFVLDGRNKKSLALDLRSPAEKASTARSGSKASRKQGRAPPAVGEHSKELLRAVGFTVSEIATLPVAGVIA